MKDDFGVGFGSLISLFLLISNYQSSKYYNFPKSGYGGVLLYAPT
jgi:hypothetical protein